MHSLVFICGSFDPIKQLTNCTCNVVSITLLRRQAWNRLLTHSSIPCWQENTYMSKKIKVTNGLYMDFVYNLNYQKNNKTL